MDGSLRELKYFVAAVEAGSFTEAAAQLYVSQAAVSRTIAALERRLGQRLLRRVPRGCQPTALGQTVLPQARRVLAEAAKFDELVRTRHTVLRLGYAWAAIGRHTTPLQRVWAREQPDVELQMVRYNAATAGLVEGFCDVAIVRREVDESRFDSAVVGLERRFVAFAADDPTWARRRHLTMAELAERVVLIDPRSGTTTRELWAGSETQPRFAESSDVDSWLDAIAAGHGVGTTAEAAVHHHRRPDVAYRPIKDGARIPVRLAWWRAEPPAGLAALIAAVTSLYAGV